MRQLTLKIRCITFLLQSLIKINLVLRFNNKLNMLDSRVTQKISENTLYSVDFKHMTNVCSQNCTGSTKQTSWEPYRPTYITLHYIIWQTLLYKATNNRGHNHGIQHLQIQNAQGTEQICQVGNFFPFSFFLYSCIYLFIIIFLGGCCFLYFFFVCFFPPPYYRLWAISFFLIIILFLFFLLVFCIKFTKTKETYNIIVPPYYCLWAITSQRLYFIGTKVLSLKLTEK